MRYLRERATLSHCEVNHFEGIHQWSGRRVPDEGEWKSDIDFLSLSQLSGIRPQLKSEMVGGFVIKLLLLLRLNFWLAVVRPLIPGLGRQSQETFCEF